MSTPYQKTPLKLYIQDIFRAKRSPENKYVYELFGLNFKNIMIHGVITSIHHINASKVNMEVSDATGTVLVYFDSQKSNLKISEETYKNIMRGFASKCSNGDEKAPIMSRLLENIVKKHKKPINIKESDYICVVGDIFVDTLSGIRMVSGYEINTTSVERDLVWMEELRYIYEKFYLWEKIV